MALTMRVLLCRLDAPLHRLSPQAGQLAGEPDIASPDRSFADACGPDGGCALVAPSGARAGQPAMVVPGAMEALQALGGAIAATDLP